jgi:isoleucyl-tRNA synthetase
MKKYNLLLPKTNFNERVDWKTHQNNILNYWNTIEINKIITQKQKKLLKTFILHLGPPYATGDLHKGHLLNYIIKNFAIRGFNNLGYQVIARQGWDCHGLPIEMKVESLYKNPNDPLFSLIRQEISDNPIIQFRKDCKNFANYWINIQKESLKLLGFAGSIDDYYTTMDSTSQNFIIGGFLKMIENNWVSRKKKVSMWSTVEKTTLSDAEIQYKDDHISHSVYFVTRITKCPLLPQLENKFMTVWTTTPWTLPGNNGYAYHKDLTYQLIQWNMFVFIAEKSLVSDICKKILTYNNIETTYEPQILLEFKGFQMEGSLAEHPIWKHDVPIVYGDFVGGVDENNNRIGEKGTGFVHIAGAHGIDDFNLSVQHKMEIIDWLDEEGYYIDNMKDLGGINALKDQHYVIELLGTKLLASEKYKHRYPYSERGKNPIIFKLSYQWFIDIDNSGIRQKAQQAVENVQWIPGSGKNRMLGMLKTRKEWVLSRQRTWGTPITWFYHKITGEILEYTNHYGPLIVNNIINTIKEKSYDFWYDNCDEVINKTILPIDLQKDYKPCKDIMDVWFESGMSHDYVVRKSNKDIIADLYIEGSDQHRGWFQSSLLTSISLYNNAPYKTVLTHGFVLDEKRQKMSKSLGNVVSLRDCCENIGCDVMSIWVAMADFTEEISFNENIINISKEIYTSIRNRCKFLLAVLNDNIIDNEAQEYQPLDQYILAKINYLHYEINKKIMEYDFRNAFILLYDFCNNDLSKLYFVYSKDIIYCDEKNSNKRKSILNIMNTILNFIMFHGRVFLPFLMEDVFLTYKNQNKNINNFSVMELDFYINDNWQNNNIIDEITSGLQEANGIMNIVEQAIKEGIIKNKSEAVVFTNFKNKKNILLDICKIADLQLGDNKVVVTNKNKCHRCWNYIIENNDELCNRCHLIENNI